MQIINLPFPEGRYTDYSDTSLDDNDFKYLKKDYYDVFIYSYGTGYYSGVGNGLSRVASTGLWDVWNFSHCSCYGPLDRDREPMYKNQTLEQLKDSSDKEYWKDIEDLWNRAKRVEEEDK